MKLKYNKLCGEINSKEIIELLKHISSLPQDEFKELIKRGNIIVINGVLIIIGTGYVIDKLYLSHKKKLKDMEEVTPDTI